ncbi:hypothetical protein RYD26_06215 [Pasteurellaceae bacterium LIM206]|nr:hypothetical protein [Pasteurellaceae bacterium LIM206]
MGKVKYIWIMLCLLFVGCSTTPLPNQLLPLRQVQQFKLQDSQGEPSILIVQPVSQSEQRWIWSNVFGVPLARQTLNLQRGWRNDGFLPPNSTASTLFSAVLYWQTPVQMRSSIYRGAVLPWQIIEKQDQATIVLSDQWWTIIKLSEETP